MSLNYINIFLYFLLGALVWPLSFWQLVAAIIVVIFIEKNAREEK